MQISYDSAESFLVTPEAENVEDPFSRLGTDSRRIPTA